MSPFITIIIKVVAVLVLLCCFRILVSTGSGFFHHIQSTHTTIWLPLQNLYSCWIYMYLFSHPISYHNLSNCCVHCSWNNIWVPIHGVYNTHPIHCKLLLKPPVTDCITHSCNDFTVLYSSKKNDCIASCINISRMVCWTPSYQVIWYCCKRYVTRVHMNVFWKNIIGSSNTLHSSASHNPSQINDFVTYLI